MFLFKIYLKGNILLNDDGIVKLADFGVSTQISKTFLKRHTFIGTPYWVCKNNRIKFL